jgi:hypothetical protein
MLICNVKKHFSICVQTCRLIYRHGIIYYFLKHTTIMHMHGWVIIQ